MIAKNETIEQTCQKLLASYFKKCPKKSLQTEANRIFQTFSDFNILVSGKPGGWAGGVIYAAANQHCIACGIPGFLNKESEEFFGVSMSTVYKRAWKVWGSLGMRGF